MRSSAVSTLFLLAAASTSQAVGPLEKRDGSMIHWSYYGEQGPLRWHSLDASFKTCGTGKYQSPINLTPTSAPIINSTSGALYLDYARTGDFTCENTGLTIQCLPKDGEAEKFKLKAKGVEYKLANFHLHTPSEHQIGGVYHPLEVHFVHASGKAGGLRPLVIAVYSVGLIRILYRRSKYEECRGWSISRFRLGLGRRLRLSADAADGK